MAYKAYTEKYIQDIANAIRRKSGKEETMKVSEMAGEILSLEVGEPTVAPISITENGVYTKDDFVGEFGEKIVGYDSIEVNVPSKGLIDRGQRVVAGKWQKPEEWDDIESQELPEDRDEMWLLYDMSVPVPFFVWRLQVNTSCDMTYEFGRIVDGEFSATFANTFRITTSANSANRRWQLDLRPYKEIFPDYMVVRCTLPTGVYFKEFCTSDDWNATDDIPGTMGRVNSPILMRYGSIRMAITHLMNAHTIESDNIVDFAKLTPTTQTIALQTAYSGDSNLQRWRQTGWSLAGKKISSISSMFANCETLQDVGEDNTIDMTGWVSSNITATSVNSIFTSCRAFTGKIIVNDWNMTKISNVSNLFNDCQQLTEVVGIETWRNMTAVTNMASMFSGCRCLGGTVDFSNSGLGTAGKLTNVSTIFLNAQSVESVIFDNCNFSAVTSMNQIFYNANNLRDVSFGGSFVPPSNKCTNFGSLFNGTQIREIVLDGWDFSGATYANVAKIAYADLNLIRFELRNCTSPKTATTADSTLAFFSNCKNVRYIDISDWDFYDGMTNASGINISFNSTIDLFDFYPPKTIGTSITLSGSPRLSAESIQRVIDSLITVSSGTKTITFGTTNGVKLTDEQKATIQSKGWTIA